MVRFQGSPEEWRCRFSWGAIRGCPWAAISGNRTSGL